MRELTFEEIKSVTVGAADISQTENGFVFHRFTQSQAEHYINRGGILAKKPTSPAGVRLEFSTGSKSLLFEMECEKASSRNYVFADIVSNGNTLAHVGSKESATGIFGRRLKLGDGIKNVKIYLPFGSDTVLRFVKLDDDATLTPAKKKLKMICFGDSVTQGHDCEYPSHSYTSMLADLLDANALNKGIGGERFVPALLDEAEPFDPDIITVAYGTNDWSFSKIPGEVEAACRTFYRRLSELYPDKLIYAITPVWRDDEHLVKATGRFLDLIEMIKSCTADLKNVTVIEGYDLIPHDIAYYWDAHVHPNQAGFIYYANRLYKKIAEDKSFKDLINKKSI